MYERKKIIAPYWIGINPIWDQISKIGERKPLEEIESLVSERLQELHDSTLLEDIRRILNAYGNMEIEMIDCECDPWTGEKDILSKDGIEIVKQFLHTRDRRFPLVIEDGQYMILERVLHPRDGEKLVVNHYSQTRGIIECTLHIMYDEVIRFRPYKQWLSIIEQVKECLIDFDDHEGMIRRHYYEAWDIS